MREHDLIVIGAGPAGSQTARYVAQQGYDVVLLEEHTQVGAPVHCSGFVTPRTLEEAAVPDGMVLNAVTGAIIHSPGGYALTLGGDKVRALVLDRKRLDERVAEAAQEAGAELHLGARLMELRQDDGGVEVQVAQNGGRATLRGRMAVGADGVGSRVAGRQEAARGEMIWCAGGEARLDDHPSDMARVYLGQELAPDWFGWSIPLGDGRVRLGVGGTMARGAPKPRHLLQRLVRAFPHHFRHMEMLSLGGGFIPLYARTPSYGERTLLVGDAARQVKPTSGGGIYTGLVAARHAATVAARALGDDDLSAERLARYEELWRRDLGDELERGANVRRVARRLGDSQIERLLRLLGHPLLRRLMNSYGDIDFPSPMFARLLRAAPLLRSLLGLPQVLPLLWRQTEAD